MRLPQSYAEKFRSALAEVKFEISDLLVRHKAVIAGSSVLGVITDTEWKDFDIYCHVDNIAEFVQDLEEYLDSKNLHVESNLNVVPNYDTSFLVRNGILGRSYFKAWAYAEFLWFFEFDVMSCERSPLKVVNNFDFTVSQTWYDGVDVFTSHPKDTLAKISYLNEDYQKVFQEENMFTMTRYLKYQDRGFTFNTSVIPPPPNRKINESWLIRSIYSRIEYSNYPGAKNSVNLTSLVDRKRVFLKEFTAREYKTKLRISNLDFFAILKKFINSYTVNYTGGINYKEFDTLNNRGFSQHQIPRIISGVDNAFKHPEQIEYFRYHSPKFDYMYRYMEDQAPADFKDPSVLMAYILDQDPGKEYRTMQYFENLLGKRIIDLSGHLVTLPRIHNDEHKDELDEYKDELDEHKGEGEFEGHRAEGELEGRRAEGEIEGHRAEGELEGHRAEDEIEYESEREDDEVNGDESEREDEGERRRADDEYDELMRAMQELYMFRVL